jgi:hypothetical protein
MAVLAQLLVTLVLVGHPGTRVPPGVQTIEIRSPDRVVRVTERRRVRRIERWLDALPAAKTGTYYCPMIIRAGTPTVRFAFRAANGNVLARASMLDGFKGHSGPCNPIVFSLPPHPGRPLTGGRFLLRVQRLLDVRFG